MFDFANAGFTTGAITANTLAKDKQRCIEAGMGDFITNHMGRTLYATMLQWLRKRG